MQPPGSVSSLRVLKTLFPQCPNKHAELQAARLQYICKLSEMLPLWQAGILSLIILACTIPDPLLSQGPMNISLTYRTANRSTEEILLSSTNVWLLSTLLVYIKFYFLLLFEGTVKYLQNFNTLSNIKNPMVDMTQVIKLPRPTNIIYNDPLINSSQYVYF